MQKSIRLLLDWLSEINVDWLTVSVPYLLELVKSRYPISVKIGVFAGVDTLEKRSFTNGWVRIASLFKQWLSIEISRLEELKVGSMRFKLIANSNCLLNARSGYITM